MFAKSTQRIVLLYPLGVAICISAALCGCRGAAPTTPAATSRIDRLTDTYEELRGGRFAILADFEDPKHMQLVQLIGVSPQARYELSPKKGRKETGPSSLVFTTGSRDDTVVLSNEQTTDWYLKRDWRGFDLLMFSVESPQKGLSVELTVSAGQPNARQEVQRSIPLEAGWNTARIDLADLGERIPLDDVRTLLLSIAGQTKPVEVHVDDILLTANSRDLLGDSTRADGALYVRQVGRRWRVGVAGRFELSFGNGQVVEWYNLEQDPSRLRNLLAGTMLGPAFASNSQQRVDPRFEKTKVGATAAPTVHGDQHIVEMNPTRVIVDCERHYAETNNAPADHQLSQRWTYTVYPTGQMYVSLDAPLPNGSLRQSFESLIIAPAFPDDCEVELDRVSTLSAGISETPSFAVAHSNEAESQLFFAVAPPDQLVSPSEADDDNHCAISIPIRTSSATANVLRLTGQFFLASGSPNKEKTLSRARAYVQPTVPQFELGQFVQPDGQPVEFGPFDRARGQYTISPDRGRVRFILDQRKEPAFSPAFEILDSDQGQVWVYVNQVNFERFGRNERGHIVFQLPENGPGKSLVEVLIRRGGS